ncbi:MAG: hypothetical protein O3A46_12505, partial [Candidatus Poribacteria bacterium]|nr:hypothetical protein [Candidatus Poribacteria bacterium]
MSPTFERHLYRNTTLAAGSLAALLGVFVMAAWHFKAYRLTHMLPNATPMVFNTAFCFALSGAGLIAYALDRRLLNRLSAVTVLVIMSSIGLEYLLHLDFGIDQLIVSDPINQRYPGRSGQTTAIVFVDFSIIMLMALVRLRSDAYRLLVAFGAFTIVSIGALGMTNYVTDTAAMLRGASFARIALPTAIGFLLLGGGLCGRLYSDARHLHILPLSAGIVG